MSYWLYSILKSTLHTTLHTTLQTRLCQWSINKIRQNVYPWLYNSWEADLILEEPSRVWLGGLDSACDRKSLKLFKIERIITAVYDIDPIFPDDPELLYLKVPVIDEPNADIAKHFNRAIDFIDESIKMNKSVLIHCVYGVSRSATLICAYLIKKKGLTVGEAIKFVKLRRPKAEPNRGFLLELERLYLSNLDKEDYDYGGRKFVQ